MELYEVPHRIGTNKNFEPFRKKKLRKSLYINKAPSNEELIKSVVLLWPLIT